MRAPEAGSRSLRTFATQARVWLPVTLVLGMSISVAALRHMLPVKAADVLQAKEFRLAQVYASPFHHPPLLRKECNWATLAQGLRLAGLLHCHSDCSSSIDRCIGQDSDALDAAAGPTGE